MSEELKDSASSKYETDVGVHVTIPMDYAGIDGDYRFTSDEVSAYILDEKVDASVLRAYDLRILPMAMLMYLFSALDRGNVSNAKSDHLDTDLHFHGNQYNIMLTVFYVPFCVCAYPGTFLTKKYGAHIMLPLYMTGWGVMAMCNAAVKNFAQCLAVRLLLGIFEGCFGASLIMYLACFYTRSELGKRMAAWYSMVAVSGAFSGLLSYGLFQVHSKLKGWQLLFLIEGGLTLIAASMSYAVLPTYPHKARFLSPAQKTAGVMRLLRDSSNQVGSLLTWREWIEPAKEWETWAWGLYCLFYGVANQTASTFLTQIVGRFGFSTVKTNLLTVGPYSCATFVLWLFVWSSDRQRERTFHVMCANALVVIGTITLACLPATDHKAGYFCTFLIASGSFVPSCLFQSFAQNNTTKENSKAFRSSVMNFGSNAGGIVTANIFLQRFAPHYVTPLIVSAAIAGTGIVYLGCLRMYMVIDNKRRNKAQGVNWTSLDVPTSALVDGKKNPSFRHFL
ncbi:hypothetical protein TREMEDRAFT_72183 [Tremella mesenterica DSM 1558]|uniref:uncharacterized protein n=1 Tax=Tremella mesenterica (strain ATCC 24925 / CBS 8224 / DSM 1558 / NBRC 9311 / NRRL Y-6157 / RJB 2259-6 / UBC 559-6) TaxID=578456 RepID=UPI0003F495EB|nr:uncharacterized protein TREMEDRAFT_72183 [Tremella mesenterica DSM 1558]EIW67160.1 hypothetical protein TREMEDRAFT_72183 [Tremella mesenterica DSM 1558]